MIQHRPLCLASASPRRAELLERLGLRFERFEPQVEESPLPGELPAATVARLAEAKARAAHQRYPGHLILAGDTEVVSRGRLLGKPADAAEAQRMLEELSGSTHSVLSAYHALDGASGQSCAGVVETRVTFRALPPAWVRWYSQLPEGRDKAGAYGIQGLGGVMVSRIEGSYTAVMGFPVESIVWDLLERGWLSL